MTISYRSYGWNAETGQAVELKDYFEKLVRVEKTVRAWRNANPKWLSENYSNRLYDVLDACLAGKEPEIK